MSGLRDAVERLRPSLRTFRDERGRELLDIPERSPTRPPTCRRLRASCPRSTTPFSRTNDRTRIIDDAGRGLSVEGARFVLVDGRVAAAWTVDRDAATLRITPLTPLTPEHRDAITGEDRRLLAFLADTAVARRGAARSSPPEPP